MNRLYVLLLFALTACNGIFDDIYDNPSDFVPEGLPYGYKSIDTDSLGGTLFFNSTDYLRWTYFDLVGFTSDTIDFKRGDDMTTLEANLKNWNIAFHRSVPKTNGGEVAATRYASVTALINAAEAVGDINTLINQEGLVFEKDQWSDNVVAIDLTNMLSGDIICQPSYYNRVLNGWLDIDISNPPPIYTPSHRAYILHLPTGEYFAIALVHFRNSSNITAWLTIEYRRLYN